MACNASWETRNSKLKAVQENHAATIQPTAAEQEAAAAAIALNATARQRWIEELAQLDLAGLLGDLRFWRVVTQIGADELKADADQATSMPEFRDRLLERLFRSTASWHREYGQSVSDIKAVNRLLALLTAT